MRRLAAPADQFTDAGIGLWARWCILILLLALAEVGHAQTGAVAQGGLVHCQVGSSLLSFGPQSARRAQTFGQGRIEWSCLNPGTTPQIVVVRLIVSSSDGKSLALSGVRGSLPVRLGFALTPNAPSSQWSAYFDETVSLPPGQLLRRETPILGQLSLSADLSGSFSANVAISLQVLRQDEAALRLLR